MWTDVVVVLISSITTIAAIILGNYLKTRKQKKDIVTNCIQRDVVIYEILNDLREKFKFSRVIVALFHNGSKYYNGEAAQKFSVVYETVAPGIDPATKSMQNIPISIMTYGLKHVAKLGYFFTDDVNTIPDEHYKNLLKSYKETKHYSYKIEDEVGWTGILYCDYTEDNDHECLSDVCAEYIRVQAERLSTLLKLTNKLYGLPVRSE